MMRIVAAILFTIGLVLIVQTPRAQITLMGVGQLQSGGAAVAYTGPGDIVSSATGWWGLRAYNAAYATGSNPGAIVCDVSTGTTCTTINILSNGNFDVATAQASSSCTVSCNVSTLYDQSGGGHNATQATNSKRPVLTFNCIGSLPCMTFTAGNNSFVATASFYAPVLPYTFTSVAQRTGNTGAFNSIINLQGSGNPALYFNNNANNVDWAASGTNLVQSASDNAWHSVIGTSNTNSTIVYVDNVSGSNAVSGSTPGSQTVGIGAGSANNSPLTGTITEVGVWAALFSGANVTSMCHNQYTYWGTSTSC